MSSNAWAQAPEIETAAANYVDAIPKAFSTAPFSGYVMVAKAGEVVFSKGFSKNEIVPKDSSHFAIGSVTKHIVALEILALEKQGLLKRSDPLKKYFRHLPKWSQSITIEQLANHTAGFTNYTGNPEFEKRKFSTLGLSDILSLADASKPAHPPLEKWAYSNTHYYILGVIIEKVTGEKYINRIQKDLLNVAGLPDVDSYEKREMIQGYVPVADPKDPTARTLEKAPLPNATGPSAAGELAMTPKEAMQWALFVANMNEEMLSKFTKGSTAKPTYGMGVFSDPKSTWISHGGGIDGFQTYFALDPKTKSAVVVLGNCISCGVPEVGDWMKSWVQNEKVPPMVEVPVTVDMKLQKSMTGTYKLDAASKKAVEKLSPRFLKMVTETKVYSTDGNLMFDLIGQPPFALKSKKDILVGPSSISVSDIKIKKGKVTEFQLNQGQLKIKYLRH